MEEMYSLDWQLIGIKMQKNGFTAVKWTLCENKLICYFD